MEQSAAVVVAQKWQRARRPHNGVEVGRHALDLVEIRLFGLSEDGVKKKHVQSVEMIVGGPLEVAAVRMDLTLHLFAHDSRALAFPVRSLWEGSEEQSQGVQCECLAQQVRVR